MKPTLPEIVSRCEPSSDGSFLSSKLIQSHGRFPLCIIIILISVCLLWMSIPASAFETDLPPGEYRPIYISKKENITLYREPNLSSSGSVFDFVKKGDEIKYVKTIYRNIKPGIIVAQKGSKLTCRNFGSVTFLSIDKYRTGIPSELCTFDIGDTFEYLLYRAEGACITRWNSSVYEFDFCPWLTPNKDDFIMKNEPVVEWWVEVLYDNKPAGWMLVEEKDVEVRRDME